MSFLLYPDTIFWQQYIFDHFILEATVHTLY